MPGSTVYQTRSGGPSTGPVRRRSIPHSSPSDMQQTDRSLSNRSNPCEIRASSPIKRREIADIFDVMMIPVQCSAPYCRAVTGAMPGSGTRDLLFDQQLCIRFRQHQQTPEHHVPFHIPLKLQCASHGSRANSRTRNRTAPGIPARVFSGNQVIHAPDRSDTRGQQGPIDLRVPGATGPRGPIVGPRDFKPKDSHMCPAFLPWIPCH